MKRIYFLLFLSLGFVANIFAQKIEAEDMTMAVTDPVTVDATDPATHGLPFSPSEGVYFVRTGGTVSHNVNFTESGTYTLKISGYHDYENNNSLSLWVGGHEVAKNIKFSAVNTWSDPHTYDDVTPSETTTATFDVTAGSVEVKLVFEKAGGCLAVDWIEFSKSTAPVATNIYEAEASEMTRSGDVWDTDPKSHGIPFAPGAGVYYTGTGATLSQNIDFKKEGIYSIRLKGYHDYGKIKDDVLSYLSVKVNGTEVGLVDFSSVNAWSDPHTYDDVTPSIDTTPEFKIIGNTTKNVEITFRRSTGCIGLDWIEIVKKTTSDVEQNIAEIDIDVYPTNSTDGNIKVDLKETILKNLNVYDINGKTIISNIKTTKNTFNLELPHNGIYFINLNTNKGIITKKVIVSK